LGTRTLTKPHDVATLIRRDKGLKDRLGKWDKKDKVY
jgi:hypothetical protein